MKKGDIIFFETAAGFLIIDHVKKIVEIHGRFLIVPQDHDWLTLEEKDLLTDSDRRVKSWKAIHQCSDKSITLKKAKDWLEYHLRDYYEPDIWSSFDFERAVEDFCVAMTEN